MELIKKDFDIIKRKKKKKSDRNLNSSLFSIYKSEKTLKDYLFYLDKFLNYIYDDVNMSNQNEIINLMINIDTGDIEDYLNYLINEKKLKNSSVNKIIFSLKSLYNELEKKGYNNSFKFIPALKTNRQNVDNILKVSFEEIKTILLNMEIKDDISLRNYTILYTLFYTGLRSSELLELKYKNIIERNGEYVLMLEKTKSGKAEYKPLHQNCYNKIMEYSDYINNLYLLDKNDINNRYIFPSNFLSNKKMTYSNLYRVIRILGENVEKQISPHNIRHSVATELSLNGADILEIRDFLGHADAKVTEVYINAKNILEKRAINRLPSIDD